MVSAMTAVGKVGRCRRRCRCPTIRRQRGFGSSAGNALKPTLRVVVEQLTATNCPVLGRGSRGRAAVLRTAVVRRPKGPQPRVPPSAAGGSHRARCCCCPRGRGFRDGGPDERRIDGFSWSRRCPGCRAGFIGGEPRPAHGANPFEHMCMQCPALREVHLHRHGNRVVAAHGLRALPPVFDVGCAGRAPRSVNPGQQLSRQGQLGGRVGVPVPGRAGPRHCAVRQSSRGPVGMMLEQMMTTAVRIQIARTRRAARVGRLMVIGGSMVQIATPRRLSA